MNRGFTITELAVVLIIASILVVLSIPTYKSVMVTARRGEAKVNLSHIDSLQSVFKVAGSNFTYGTIPKANPVGYASSGCSGSGWKNELGFRPNRCGELRYQYWSTGGSDFTAVAYGPSDAAGKYIYPDCTGAGSPAQGCNGKNYSQGDVLMLASTNGKVDTCRNILEYCPTPGGGTPSTPSAPSTPGVTPTPTCTCNTWTTSPAANTICSGTTAPGTETCTNPATNSCPTKSVTVTGTKCCCPAWTTASDTDTNPKRSTVCTTSNTIQTRNCTGSTCTTADTQRSVAGTKICACSCTPPNPFTLPAASCSGLSDANHTVTKTGTATGACTGSTCPDASQCATGICIAIPSAPPSATCSSCSYTGTCPGVSCGFSQSLSESETVCCSGGNVVTSAPSTCQGTFDIWDQTACTCTTCDTTTECCDSSSKAAVSKPSTCTGSNWQGTYDSSDLDKAGCCSTCLTTKQESQCTAASGTWNAANTPPCDCGAGKSWSWDSTACTGSCTTSPCDDNTQCCDKSTTPATAVTKPSTCGGTWTGTHNASDKAKEGCCSTCLTNKEENDCTADTDGTWSGGTCSCGAGKSWNWDASNCTGSCSSACNQNLQCCNTTTNTPVTRPASCPTPTDWLGDYNAAPGCCDCKDNTQCCGTDAVSNAIVVARDTTNCSVGFSWFGNKDTDGCCQTCMDSGTKTRTQAPASPGSKCTGQTITQTSIFKINRYGATCSNSTGGSCTCPSNQIAGYDVPCDSCSYTKENCPGTSCKRVETYTKSNVAATGGISKQAACEDSNGTWTANSTGDEWNGSCNCNAGSYSNRVTSYDESQCSGGCVCDTDWKSDICLVDHGCNSFVENRTPQCDCGTDYIIYDYNKCTGTKKTGAANSETMDRWCVYKTMSFFIGADTGNINNNSGARMRDAVARQIRTWCGFSNSDKNSLSQKISGGSIDCNDSTTKNLFSSAYTCLVRAAIASASTLDDTSHGKDEKTTLKDWLDTDYSSDTGASCGSGDAARNANTCTIQTPKTDDLSIIN